MARGLLWALAMRIDPPDPKRAEAHKPKDGFKKALLQQGLRAKVPGRAAGVVSLKETAAQTQVLSLRLAEGFGRDVKGQAVLRTARGETEVSAQSRTEDRSQGVATQESRAKARIGELLARELGRRPDAPLPIPQVTPRREESTPSDGERESGPSSTSGVEGRRGAQAAAPSEPTPEVHSVAEVIEKVELLMRSNRPALALTLGGELSGQLEIEKVGPGKVALTLRGAGRDPGAPERIRKALAQRGLTVSRLQVG